MAATWASTAERGAFAGLWFTATVYRLLGRAVTVCLMAPLVLYFYCTGKSQREASLNWLRLAKSRGAAIGEVNHLAGLKHQMTFAGGALDLESLVVPPLYIPETTTVLKALELFKQTPHHMALVVNEFGALEGVVTAIDILEMIAGDFPESHDEDTAKSIIVREDGSWLVDGRTDLDVQGDGLLFGPAQPTHQQVWMSHFDSITVAPEGFSVTATTADVPVAALEDAARGIAADEESLSDDADEHAGDLRTDLGLLIAGESVD